MLERWDEKVGPYWDNIGTVQGRRRDTKDRGGISSLTFCELGLGHVLSVC